MESKFDDIRPYYDSEVPAAAARMIGNQNIDAIAEFLGLSGEMLRNRLSKCVDIDSFQSNIMAFAVEKILENTSKGVTYGGLHYFEGGDKHLIVTNHRDIVLDAAIIQLILHNHGVKTTEMAVGDNLISSKFVEDIARSNKMIKVVRSTSPREVYESSKLLSEYIRSKVVSQESSIWIAQRNGRTKDGHDMTEQGLLKMFEMSGSGDFIKDNIELNILPVAISYEYEPCDLEKTHELYESRRHKYVKAPDEDFNSILKGIEQWKGRIHFEFTEPVLPEEVEYCANFKKNERFQELAKIIDKQIHTTYKLWPNNYIAADLLAEVAGKKAEFAEKYTPEERLTFERYAEKQIAKIEGDEAELRDIFLHIYANPLYYKG
ncbi:MAG: 1-acyl-sn-glycerol-3-phosphate acyltransferase [Candidatus Egerieousia sp.]